MLTVSMGISLHSNWTNQNVSKVRSVDAQTLCGTYGCPGTPTWLCSWFFGALYTDDSFSNTLLCQSWSCLTGSLSRFGFSKVNGESSTIHQSNFLSGDKLRYLSLPVLWVRRFSPALIDGFELLKTQNLHLGIQSGPSMPGLERHSFQPRIDRCNVSTL